MCGIAGVIYADRHRPVDPGILKAMGDSIAHRGPDAEGFWIEPGVGLAHRRLSIIDLEGGKQPWATRMARSRSSSMGRSTTFRAYDENLSFVGTDSRRTATPRSWSTSTRRWEIGWSIGCEACSPLHSGTEVSVDWSWPATGWG